MQNVIIMVFGWCATRTKKRGEKMNNTALLEDKIKQSGKKITYLAQKVGLSYAGFRNCVINKAEFKSSQIDILCAELGVNSLQEKESIFFAKYGA